MKRTHLLAALFFALISTTTGSATAQQTENPSVTTPKKEQPVKRPSLEEPIAIGPSPTYRDVVLKLRTAIKRELKAKNVPAFSIALVDKDGIVWAKGFGFQDADKKIPADARTIYRVGSVSKLFTDTAIMQLVEDGQLSLDAPVTDYLPNFTPDNPFGSAVTLRRLMSHRSGLVREPPVGHYFDPTEPPVDQIVESLNETSLVYEPDTKTKYSNAAITVVGHVLEEQRKLPFAKAIEESILAPLEMTSSSFELRKPLDSYLADAWMWSYDGRQFPAPTFTIGTVPAGNLYSNVLDLANFLQMILNDGRWRDQQIIDTDTLAQMTTAPESTEDDEVRYGIGFRVDELDSHKLIGHGGLVYGFSTQLAALPEEKLGVAAAASIEGTNGLERRLTKYALRLMLAQRDGKPLPDLASSDPVPTEQAMQLVGLYDYQGGNEKIRVHKDNDRLLIRHKSLERELRSGPDGLVLDDRFGYDPKVDVSEPGRIVIEDDEGKRFEYNRVEDELSADAPARWKGLIGEYGWDHDVLFIFEDNGQLYALIEWFFFYPLEELSENEFAFPDDKEGLYHGEKLIFKRDADGKATEVIAAGVPFKRRSIGTLHGETFKIKPVRPIEELRAGARAATPPEEEGRFRETDLVELITLDPTIKLDIRYASTNNFTGSKFYQRPRAFMQRPAAEAVVRANRRLKEHGLGLLIHDAYRPWFVTKMFWDATPDDLKDFVANPAEGSRHNRGCAVDLTMYDLKTGEPIEMVAGYDEFSARSYPNYPGGTSRQRWYRQLLREAMEAEGFTIYDFEWWHFDYRDWPKYRIHNLTFDQIDEKANEKKTESNDAATG